MPVIEIERPTSASRQQAWAFISDMDHWAPLLTGYETHEQIDARKSRWIVKGELGGLSRRAEFDVAITEWEESDHIAFTLQGIDEPFAGGGAFHIVAPDDAPQDAPPRQGWWSRLWGWIARRLLDRVTATAANVARDGDADTQTMLRCRLEVIASGGSGPIMNLLLPPILDAVANGTAERIVAALERREDR